MTLWENKWTVKQEFFYEFIGARRFREGVFKGGLLP
jgi:hypothetical protein